MTVFKQVSQTLLHLPAPKDFHVLPLTPVRRHLEGLGQSTARAQDCCQETDHSHSTCQWRTCKIVTQIKIPEISPNKINDTFSGMLHLPEVLNVHVFFLLLAEAMLEQAFPWPCLAAHHGLSHGVVGRAVRPGTGAVYRLKSVTTNSTVFNTAENPKASAF